MGVQIARRWWRVLTGVQRLQYPVYQRIFGQNLIRYRAICRGILAGKKLIEDLENGDITLAPDEKIRIVGHSHGAAFAAGIATILMKHEKYSKRLDAVHYIAAHDPGGFAHPPGIEGTSGSPFSTW